MFNHECLQREGQVVGACMDGFLFGACCELPKGVSVGDFVQFESVPVSHVNNDITTKRTVGGLKKPSTSSTFDISSGVSQITASLLNPNILPTAEDNQIFQLKDSEPFATTGVTHQNIPETVIANQDDNEIDPIFFKPTSFPALDIKKSTINPHTPLVSISISNAPLEYTTVSGFHRPIFRPKPAKPSGADKYVLVPTITHDISKPNKTEFEQVINIVEWLNSSSVGPLFPISTKRPALANISSPSSSYPSISTTIFRRPESTTPKLPSTSYVFSSTTPPRRTEPTTTKRTIKTKPTKKTTVSFTYSLAPAKTTLAYSPEAFPTSTRPPSTSYVYSSTPTRRPPSTVGSPITPGYLQTPSSIPSPAPTLIVLGPIPQETEPPEITPTTYEQVSPIVQKPTTTIPHRIQNPIKPINHVTINNHIVQNIYSTSERPSPTVLITPKPNILTSSKPVEDSEAVEVLASGAADDLNNFPPDRNPNLNLSSLNNINENDITTPVFIEDEQLDKQVESFVNKIVQGLQEPFQGLREVVYNRNNATILKVGTTSVRPKQGTTTKKPVVTKPIVNKPGTTRPGTKPSTKPPTKPTVISAATTKPSSGTKPVITRKPTTKKPSNTNSSKKPTTTTKKPKITKKPVITTTDSYIEPVSDLSLASIDPEDYKTRESVFDCKIVNKNFPVNYIKI